MNFFVNDGNFEIDLLQKFFQILPHSDFGNKERTVLPHSNRVWNKAKESEASKKCATVKKKCHKTVYNLQHHENSVFLTDFTSLFFRYFSCNETLKFEKFTKF